MKLSLIGVLFFASVKKSTKRSSRKEPPSAGVPYVSSPLGAFAHKKAQMLPPTSTYLKNPPSVLTH